MNTETLIFTTCCIILIAVGIAIDLLRQIKNKLK